MKKRILSLLLVLTFVLCALPLSLSAAEVGDGSKISDWTAKIGKVVELENGVFQIPAYNEAEGPSTLVNKKQVRQAMYNGEYTAAKISITFDSYSVMAGRADDPKRANDQGIIFGGSGIKAFGANKTDFNAADIEYAANFYFLYFSGNNLVFASVEKDRMQEVDGEIKSKPFKTITSVKLSEALGASWDTIKNSGKIKLDVEYTAQGAIKVRVNGNPIEKLSYEAGTYIPYGGEIGVRTGMGYHVPTKILAASITPITEIAPETPDTPEVTDFEGWTAKVGSISALEGGLFRIDGNKLKAARQAIWNKYMTEGKISVTFDTDSLMATRAPDAETNPNTGSNDTAIIFGGKAVYGSKGNSVNNIENISQYYVVMFMRDTLLVNRVNYGWQKTTEEFPARISIDLSKKYPDQWQAIKDSGKVKLTVEFTEKGAVKVSVGDIHITELDRDDGSCVPFGGEVGIRAGMGYHVDTKIFDVTIEGNVSDEELTVTPDTPDDPTDTPDDPTDTPDDPTDTPDDPADTPDDETPKDEAPKDEAPEDETPNDDENKGGGSMTWIIIAAVAAVAIIVAIIGVVIAKKKKA